MMFDMLSPFLVGGCRAAVLTEAAAPSLR
jgi:hypothetical protein